MSKSIEATIECPFYVEEGTEFIKCEGLLPKTVCIHQFVNSKEKREYEKNVCSVNSGKKCKHYRNVHILYDLNERVIK